MARYKVGDRIVSGDTEVVVGGIRYFPGRLTPADRVARGITDVPEPAPVDHQFYEQAGDGPPRPRAVSEICAAVLHPAIKAQARVLILSVFPEWRQANMTARAVELLRKGEASWTAAETAEAAVIEGAWGWIKAVRARSGALEVEASALTFEAALAWQPHDWPAPPAGA